MKKLTMLVFEPNEKNYKEGNIHWAVQGLEYDICAEGDNIMDAMNNFAISLLAEIDYCTNNKLTLRSIGAAPNDLWEIAQQEREEDNAVYLDSDNLKKVVFPDVLKKLNNNINFEAMIV